MDIYERVNNIIRKLERAKSKTISKKEFLNEIEKIADFVLNLNFISIADKHSAKKIWDIAHKYRQPKSLILREMRAIKTILDSYNVSKEIKKQILKPGRVIIFLEKQNFTAYDKLRELFCSAIENIKIIDPYLNSETFKLFAGISKQVRFKLITNNFFGNSKTDFNKFKKEYIIEARENKNIHDRFFIIDGSSYFLGSSLHDVGNKLSAIAFLNSEDGYVLKEAFEKIWNKSKKID